MRKGIQKLWLCKKSDVKDCKIERMGIHLRERMEILESQEVKAWRVPL